LLAGLISPNVYTLGVDRKVRETLERAQEHVEVIHRPSSISPDMMAVKVFVRRGSLQAF
jgi:predicted GTPase